MQRNKAYIVFPLILGALLASGCSTPCVVGIHEIPSPANARNAIPKEALATLRDFVAYIARREPDLFHNASAQNRFLTKELREAVAYRWQLYQEYIKTHDAHSPPSNGTFVGSWEYPSGYVVEGGRQAGNQVAIEVLFKWECPEDNYYGDTRRVSYTFLLEGGSWKLSDAYIQEGRFVKAYSLKEELWRKDYEF